MSRKHNILPYPTNVNSYHLGYYVSSFLIGLLTLGYQLTYRMTIVIGCWLSVHRCLIGNRLV